MSNVPAVEFRAVSLSFDEKAVLSNVSFKLGSGETLFLMGATGSGKSILLKLALGLLKPNSGQILIDGQDIVPLTEEELDPVRQRMGMVFQEGALFDSLSVYDNVAYRLHETAEPDEVAIEERVREVLRFVELEDAIFKMPAELSGGMRRRVSIARAIIYRPSIMLYDSPTAGLDPVTAHTINILIAKLRDVGHATSVVVTHRIQNAVELDNFVYSAEKQALVPAPTDGRAASRPVSHFLVTRDGRVYFHGDGEDLAATRDPYLQKFLV